MGLLRKILAGLFLLWKAIKKFDSDHGFLLSSGITFNLLVCLIPIALLSLALIGSYLYSSHEVLHHLRRYLEQMGPRLDPRMMEDILRVIQDRKIVGILGIAGLIWTCTWVFSSVRTALNVVFQVEKGRGILRAKATDLLMLFLAGGSLLASMTLTTVVAYLRRHTFSGQLDLRLILGFCLRYLLPFFFTLWMFFLVYKIAPDKKSNWRTALRAALFTSLLWEIAKQLFGWYVLHLGRFSMVYGPLSTLVIFVLWVYYSSVILLLGGEVAFFLEKERRDNHD